MDAGEPAQDVLGQGHGDGARGAAVLLRPAGTGPDGLHNSHSIGNRAHRILLPLVALVGGVGIAKGLGPGVADGIDFYWLLSYEHGFIRRALLGTLFRPLLKRASYQQLKPVIFNLHVGACVATVVLLTLLFWHALAREGRRESRITLMSAFLCLMCSPLLPTLGHDVGYVDVYLIVLLLVGVWLALRERYFLAAAVVLVAPLIHESFLFMWAPVALVLAWSCVETRRDVTHKLVLAAAPIVSSAAVVFLQNPETAARAIDALPVSETLKDGLRLYQIEQTVASSFAMMWRSQFPGNGARVATSLAFFLIPSLAMVSAAAFCHWALWRTRWMTLLIVVAAALLPVVAIAFAWDLSRFVVWSNLTAAVAVVSSGTLLAGRERPA